MRTLVTVFVPLAVIATSAGCAPHRHAATPMAHPCAGKQAQAPNGARVPEDLDRLFGERLNAGDVDGVVALYEPTATLVRQDRSSATGTTAIREEIAGFAALRPHITLNVFRVLSGGSDVAVVYDDWTATGTDANGKHVELSGHASEVVRRGADGSWRFVVDDPDARSAPSSAAPRHHPAKRQHHKAAHPAHSQTTK
jgi:ketosteroid isomerase-like protein